MDHRHVPEDERDREAWRRRQRLNRRVAPVALPFVLVGVVLLLTGRGPGMLVMAVGNGLMTLSWIVGAWLYPRPLRG